MDPARALASALVIAGAMAPAPSIAAPPHAWSFSALADRADTYVYRHLQYSAVGFDAPPFAGARVERHLNGALSLVAEGGWLDYHGHIGIITIADFPLARPTAQIRATVVPAGLGLRLRVPPGRLEHVSPFVSVLPAVFVTRWSESRTNPTGLDAFTTTRPGLIVEGGFQFHATRWLAVEPTLRSLTWAGSGTRTLGEFSRGEFAGGNLLDFGLALTLTP